MKKPMLENPNIVSAAGSKERKVRTLAMALSVGSSVMNVKYTMLRIDVTYQYHVPNLRTNVTDLEQMSSDMFCRWVLRLSASAQDFEQQAPLKGA